MPIFFLLSPANVHDSPFARPLLEWAVRLYHLHPRIIRLDAAYWSLRLIIWIHQTLHATAVIRLPPSTSEESLLSAAHLDQSRTRQAQFHPSLLWPRLPVLPRDLAHLSAAGQPSPDKLL
ncbi:MAG TPA: transposase [Ktedonobacteraceae bacterium]|nr:transposase [Ktedonobacteraceae bacterium]